LPWFAVACDHAFGREGRDCHLFLTRYNRRAILDGWVRCWVMGRPPFHLRWWPRMQGINNKTLRAPTACVSGPRTPHAVLFKPRSHALLPKQEYRRNSRPHQEAQSDDQPSIISGKRTKKRRTRSSSDTGSSRNATRLVREGRRGGIDSQCTWPGRPKPVQEEDQSLGSLQSTNCSDIPVSRVTAVAPNNGSRGVALHMQGRR